MIQGFVFYVDSEKDCSRFRKQIIYYSEKYEKDKILYYEKYEKIECNATLCTFRSKKRTKTIFTFWGVLLRILGIISKMLGILRILRMDLGFRK